MTTETIDKIRKTLDLIKEILQFAIVLLIAILAIAALAKPSLARAQLVRWGVEVREISVVGVKLAVAQSITVSDALSDAVAKLDETQARLKLSNGSPEATQAMADAVKGLKLASAALEGHEKKIKEAQRDAGLNPDIPPSAWITVGVLSESAGLLPAARIDKERTQVSGNSVKTVALKQDAIVRTEDQCTTPIDISNAPAPSDEQMQKLVILLRAGEYTALETHACPTRSKGLSLLSARVAITENAVRLAQFAAVKN